MEVCSEKITKESQGAMAVNSGDSVLSCSITAENCDVASGPCGNTDGASEHCCDTDGTSAHCGYSDGISAPGGDTDGASAPCGDTDGASGPCGDSDDDDTVVFCPEKKRTSLSRSDKFRLNIKRKSSQTNGSLTIQETDRLSEDSMNENAHNNNSHPDDLKDELISGQSKAGEESSCSVDAETNSVNGCKFSTKRQATMDKYKPIAVVSNDEEEEEEFQGLQEFHLDEDDGQEEASETHTRHMDNLTKNEERIHHICTELLFTEENYAKRIKDLVEIKHKTKRILSDGLAKNMFPKVEVISQLHQDFLPSLRERINNWTPESKIGDLMQKMTPFLKLYTEYVQNFQTASQLVQVWKGKNLGFGKMVNHYSTRQKGGLDIGARMIEPIQRVPRYELLLKDYMKRLPEGSLDKISVKKALVAVSDAATHFETMMSRDARISTLAQLQRSLDGGVNIFSFSRELITCTEVLVMNHRTKKQEECSVYLFNDLLLITRDTHTMGSKRKKVKHLIDLAKAKVTSNDDGPNIMVVSTRIASVEIQFRTAVESVTWEQKLRYQLAESTKRKFIRRGTWQDLKRNKSLGETAPHFVLPHTVTVCMACGSQFDTPKRKKNCGACGMVVCGKCSTHQMILPYDRANIQRVCHPCFTTLNMHRQNSV